MEQIFSMRNVPIHDIQSDLLMEWLNIYWCNRWMAGNRMDNEPEWIFSLINRYYNFQLLYMARLQTKTMIAGMEPDWLFPYINICCHADTTYKPINIESGKRSGFHIPSWHCSSTGLHAYFGKYKTIAFGKIIFIFHAPLTLPFLNWQMYWNLMENHIIYLVVSKFMGRFLQMSAGLRASSYNFPCFSHLLVHKDCQFPQWQHYWTLNRRMM